MKKEGLWVQNARVRSKVLEPRPHDDDPSHNLCHIKFAVVSILAKSSYETDLSGEVENISSISIICMGYERVKVQRQE